MTALIDRRSIVAAIGLMLGGCAAQRGVPSAAGFYPFAAPEFASAYGPIFDQGHTIPALDLTRIDPALLRQRTGFAGPYRPGTIVVNVGERRLYLVQPSGAQFVTPSASVARKLSIFVARPSSAERPNGPDGRRRRT